MTLVFNNFFNYQEFYDDRFKLVILRHGPLFSLCGVFQDEYEGI